MPRRYQGIKQSMREQYPSAPLSEIKTRAAKVYESTRKPHEKHLSTAVKQERTRRAR